MWVLGKGEFSAALSIVEIIIILMLCVAAQNFESEINRLRIRVEWLEENQKIPEMSISKLRMEAILFGQDVIECKYNVETFEIRDCEVNGKPIRSKKGIPPQPVK